ncbi:MULTISPECIES: hypothetical protein [Microcoleaceae]|uniref:hypothetical protein n=1 Tax=Microcoleaceae TaxID=1892252 RepID=UPI001882E284|nr:MULTISPECIES: hypothetical protein [unclassified Tychonema]MBE9120552.1 hypothetical protein [Tychonema sp. LEGE 07199]MBE9132693.1 hypothetical protein [Tychonema sp. LEGE 07196]
MRADIQGLEITVGELRHLCGAGPDRVYRPATATNFAREVLKTVGLIVLVIISCWLLVAIFPRAYLFWFALHLAAICGLIFEDAWKIWSSQNKDLINLFDDVDRYNGIIKAIEINDRIEDAGNAEVKIGDRAKVIQALQAIREDLVRALKTERILRENKKFVATNSELFANNLRTLNALQISDRASKQGRLLNEALQLATEVQAEIKKLQDRNTAN